MSQHTTVSAFISIRFIARSSLRWSSILMGTKLFFPFLIRWCPWIPVHTSRVWWLQKFLLIFAPTSSAIWRGRNWWLQRWKRNRGFHFFFLSLTLHCMMYKPDASFSCSWKKKQQFWRGRIRFIQQHPADKCRRHSQLKKHSDAAPYALIGLISESSGDRTVGCWRGKLR